MGFFERQRTPPGRSMAILSAWVEHAGAALATVCGAVAKTKGLCATPVRVWCGGDLAISGLEAQPRGQRRLGPYGRPSSRRRISRLNADGGLSALANGAAGRGSSERRSRYASAASGGLP